LKDISRWRHFQIHQPQTSSSCRKANVQKSVTQHFQLLFRHTHLIIIRLLYTTNVFG
jgi:hypothetical protein